jgi:hypothetical protein
MCIYGIVEFVTVIVWNVSESSQEQKGTYWVLRGHIAQAKGDHLDRVHSDQMILVMFRQKSGCMRGGQTQGLHSLKLKPRGSTRLESSQIR